MGRPKKLSLEEIQQLIRNEEKWTLKQWARHFGVSYVTALHARNGRLAYASTSEG